MKSSSLTKIVGAGILSLSLAVLPSALPASAQTGTGTGSDSSNTSPNSTGTSTQTQGTDYAASNEGNDFDWGWLGLLGLAGLAGLARKREEPTVYRDPAEPVSRPGYRE